ncbi:hypothetical protein [Aureispira sp. CCB-QB1]|uniref:hypothetical protein n=1 Tax=Aureispira sp. CCB-QB1 TaxID=1313421 RepID=UPI0012DF20D3|nr:hypothetical protein [Aureispira sp. CCB-QB1]
MEFFITPIALIVGTFLLGFIILSFIYWMRKGNVGHLPPNQASADYPFTHFRHLTPESL